MSKELKVTLKWEYLQRTHNEQVKDKHGLHNTGRKCDGKLYYDEGLEGNLCPKCDYYDGVK